MRIHFRGSFKGLDPVFLIYTTPDSYTFDKTAYPDHTNYDVMVIGAGGGMGGGLQGDDSEVADSELFVYGGASGGGGSYRVKGLLSFLDDSTDIVVGAMGANGDDSVDDPDASTDGEDGEASSFGSVVASGGKGGKRAQSFTSSENYGNDGGDGGVGNSGTAGGGALGGQAGLNTPDDIPEFHHGENGEDGTLILGTNGLIGKGGGGGAGGVIRHYTSDDTWVLIESLPTNGGRGSYNIDGEVYSPYGPPQPVTPSGAPHSFLAKPGRGGGARVTPFNKSNATYGDSRKNGVVIIKLTAE